MLAVLSFCFSTSIVDRHFRQPVPVKEDKAAVPADDERRCMLALLQHPPKRFTYLCTHRDLPDTAFRFRYFNVIPNAGNFQQLVGGATK